MSWGIFYYGFRFSGASFDAIRKKFSSFEFDSLQLKTRYSYDDYQNKQKADPVLFFGNLETSDFVIILVQENKSSESLEPAIKSCNAKIHHSVFKAWKWRTKQSECY
jgi:hypothetical protein